MSEDSLDILDILEQRNDQPEGDCDFGYKQIKKNTFA